MKPAVRTRQPVAASDEADRREAMRLVPVSRETEARLAVYVDLLHRWQRVKNLVGKSTLESVWTRHVADSSQLLDILPAARRWVDLGSGAGFPGLVVAILLHGLDGAVVDLVESNERKCAFLREAVRACGAPARVHMGRIEVVLPDLHGVVDAVTSRALAPLPELVGMSETLLLKGATGIFLKGSEELGDGFDLKGRQSGTIGEETTARFDYEAVPSRTNPNARIVLVRKAGLSPVADTQAGT